MQQQVLQAYGFNSDVVVQPFGTGLINHTWAVYNGKNKLILQRINHKVFKSPEDIAANIRRIGKYLSEHHPGYLFVTPEQTLQQQDIVYLKGEGYYRLFPFIKGSHTIDVVHTATQAYEAAKQFGRFTRLLCDFPCEQLKVTLPDFHNLPLRYQQFEEAIRHGNRNRISEATELIRFLQHHHHIVAVSAAIENNPAFIKRVTHHDTKISNVLFDENDKGLCVIDLDTVMPGYFISDAGDMLRTYLSPVSEEETDFSKIEIRKDYFKAIATGYLGEMGDVLSDAEKAHFVYAGKFMIYMQALRFLTDYLNDDIYYGSKYEGHNLMRAKNQLVLLERLLAAEQNLNKILLEI
ncbi:MAG TPA: aminoglycoside phosphotransferase family protein [Ferruginibacter sp.]|nr:aminoglycoside phosphotransferase family protein [Ferruginibacter sp.]HMP22313.1 aminoglycoside phosphotransferase family protein [Ferruginibacter sp.]